MDQDVETSSRWTTIGSLRLFQPVGFVEAPAQDIPGKRPEAAFGMQASRAADRGTVSDDTVEISRDSDVLYDRAGNYRLFGGQSLEDVSEPAPESSGEGAVAARGIQASRAVIRGNFRDDTVEGSPASDVLYGGGGKDKLLGGLGQDTIFGGNDNDTVFGNDGNDLVYGGNGNDFLIGDTFENEQVEPGFDQGGDTIYGGAGDDQFYGRLDDDLLFGGVGRDYFKGGTGNDTNYGGSGNDHLQISNGNDSLFGGAGDDVLSDGLGSDDYFGGAGADFFVYEIADDVDRDEGGPTYDYGAGDDRMHGVSLNESDTIVFLIEYGAVVSDIVDDGTSTAFFLSNGEVVTLLGFTGEDFEGGLRFESVEAINALSQQRYGYDAVLLNDYNAVPYYDFP